MPIIAIYGGYVWIEQETFSGIPTLLYWGAHRRFSELPADVANAYESGVPHWRYFAAPAGHVAGMGYIKAIQIMQDGFGSYEFVGVGKPEIKRMLA